MSQRFYILDWESNGEGFLENITLTPRIQSSLHIYIVYKAREIPSKLLPQFRHLHVPRNATITSLKDTKWEPLVRRLAWQNPRCAVVEKKEIYLVAKEPKVCFGHLIDLLTSEKLDFRLLQSENACILDEFHLKCVKCRMIFTTKRDFKKHDEKFCGYFEECLTHSGNQKVGYSKSVRNVAGTNECTSCLSNCVLTYCPHKDRAKDMTTIHNTRYVGKTHLCESTFDTVNYSAHFLYGYEQLPCLAVIGCSKSFPSLQEQAHHHVTEHGCVKPYFCAVCYRLLKTVNFENEAELLNHGRLEGHCEAEFSFA